MTYTENNLQLNKEEKFMKTKYSLITTTILLISALTMCGQTPQAKKSKPLIKNNDISSVLTTPDYESTVDSLKTKVWIITLKKYKELVKTATGKTMSKPKNSNIEVGKTNQDAIIAGTHCLIFDVTNFKSGKELADTSAKVEISSPTKKVTSVHLQPLMSYFGGGIMLNERGQYLFTINLNIGSGYKTTQFKYKVR